MTHRGMSLEAAMGFTADKRKSIRPNPGFMQQLIDYEVGVGQMLNSPFVRSALLQHWLLGSEAQPLDMP